MMEELKISMKENAQKERQIVVDAVSLNESSTVSISLAATDMHRPSLQLQPPKPKFLSFSLPNSANSSPLFTSNRTKNKPKRRSIESPCQASTLKHKNLLQEMHLRRSKSCGEGRACAASDEFDLWLVRPNSAEGDNFHCYSFSKTEAIKEGPVSGKDMETCEDEGFKCSALCLYLPVFGKAKAAKTRKDGSEMEDAISRTVSLEKFECVSWASSALFHENTGDPMNSFFDLPTELIKCCDANDVHAPVTSTFVFEKNVKGVLKIGSSGASARNSDTTPQQVRFSVSSSTSHPSSPVFCITPLRKAREDFHAFLEAQSA